MTRDDEEHAATAEQAGNRVPYHVLQAGLPLARCPDCDRFYWPASHAGRMRRRLEVLRRTWQRERTPPRG